MKLTIQIPEKEFKKLGFASSNVEWEDFLITLKSTIAKDALQRCKEISEKAGLDKISLDEINAEIKAVRNAKISH